MIQSIPCKDRNPEQRTLAGCPSPLSPFEGVPPSPPPPPGSQVLTVSIEQFLAEIDLLIEAVTADNEDNDTKPGTPLKLVETWEFTFCLMLRDGYEN